MIINVPCVHVKVIVVHIVLCAVHACHPFAHAISRTIAGAPIKMMRCMMLSHLSLMKSHISHRRMECVVATVSRIVHSVVCEEPVNDWGNGNIACRVCSVCTRHTLLRGVVINVCIAILGFDYEGIHSLSFPYIPNDTRGV